MKRLSSALLAVLSVAALLAAPASAKPSGTGGATPNDQYYAPYQWGPQQINAEQAWATSTGQGQTIAIVDTGIDLRHPDLAKKIVGGATFTGCAQDGPCGDGDWESGNTDEAPSEHGTHVAGIAAAITNNRRGIAGVAPDANLLAVKVLTDEGGSFEEVAAGVRWSADHGADVINMSLGALPGVQALPITGLVSDLREAVDYAASKGVTVVAAAGNEFFPLCDEPAFDPNILCVIATNEEEAKASYSNFGFDQSPDNIVAAPGGDLVGLGGVNVCTERVISSVPTGHEGRCGSSTGENTPGYDFFAGTSMATPHVAGVAALLTAQGRDRIEVQEVLKATARTPGVEARGTFTPVYGYGIVDAAAAVASPLGG